MNGYSRMLIGVLAGGLLLGAAACGRGGDPVLAQVGDRKITQSDFVNSYFRLKPEDRPALDTEEAKTAFLQDLVNKNLMELAAFKKYPDMAEPQQWRFQRFTWGKLEEAVTAKLVRDMVTVTEAEKDLAWQNMHRDVYLDGIVLPSEDAAQAMVDRLKNGADLGQLALEYSIQEAADQDHPEQLGWAAWGTYPWEMESAVWAGKPGDILGPYEDVKRHQWYVVRVGDSRDVPVEGDREGMDQMLDLQIREPRYMARQKAVLDSLRDAAGVGFPTDGEVLIMKKFYWEPPENLKDDPMAFLNDPRVMPTLEADEETVTVITFKTVPNWTAADFIERLAWYPPGVWPRGHAVDQLHEVYDMLLRDFLIRKAAADLGYDKDPELIDALDRKGREMRVTYLYQNDVIGKVEPTDEEILAWFEENKERYKAPPSAKLASFGSTDKALMESLRDDWRSGMRFGDLKDKYIARDPQLEAIGETPWLHEGSDAPLDDFLKPLKEKAVSDVFARGDHFYVFQVIARRGTRVVQYEEAKKYVDDDYRTVVREQRLQDFLKAQEAEYGVKIDEAALKKLKVPAEAPGA